MSPLVAAISVAGALAVAAFAIFGVLGVTRGWNDPAARRMRSVGLGFGIACALLGVMFTFVDS